MDDKDHVFARFKDNKPGASDRRELLTIQRRAGASGSRTVEVVHVRSGGAVRDRPRRADPHVHAASYEPFLGSGTTIIAAEMTGRSCHAIELSPAHADVAVARWEAFTGQQAVREGGGTLFSGLGPGPASGAPTSPTEAPHAPI